MLELLKILAEMLTKSISPEAIAKARRTKKLSDMGTDVFLMYSDLNNVLVYGRRILDELESGIPWMRRKVQEGEPSRIYWHSIAFELKQQLSLLKHFTSAFARLSLELQVLEPEVAMGLAPIIAGKINVLTLLANAISRPNAPTRLVSLDERKMRALMAMASSNDLQQRDALYDAFRSFRFGGPLLDGLIVYEGIPDVTQISASQFPLVEAYLKSGKAKEALDELERLAHLLRVSIEKNFSIQDILLNVGDGRGAL